MVKKAANPTLAARQPVKPAAPPKRQPRQSAKARDISTWRLMGLGVLAVAVAFFVMNAIFGDNGRMIYRQRQKQLEMLKQEVTRLQKENQTLEKQIQGLRSDPKVIDRIAHDQLHMVRPNQTIFTLSDQDSKDDSKRPPAAAQTGPAKP